MSMRASVQCEIRLAEIRLPASAQLPEARGFARPFSCLNEARYGIAWGVLGAARDSYLTALEYAQGRMQFNRPIASFQLTQAKLADMAVKITQGQLVALRLGRLKERDQLQGHQISLGKLSNTRDAIESPARRARPRRQRHLS